MEKCKDNEEISFLSDSSSDIEICNKEKKFFHFEHVDSVDTDEFDFTMPPKVSIQMPPDSVVDLFVFHIHEEDGQIFLFCKQLIEEKYYTVCIQVLNPYYYVQFLPISGHEFEIVGEVKEVANRIGGSLISYEMKELLYSFENVLIPKRANYCCATFSSKCNISKIKPKGTHYSHVFGISAPLSESIFVRRKVNGPSWIRCTNLSKKKRISTIPMFAIPTIDDITPIDTPTIPPMNIGTISIRSFFHSHEIYMISLRVLHEWDIIDFSGSGSKSFTLVSTDLKSEQSHSNESKNIFFYKNEKELLINFCQLVDDFDIDIICSYGLTTIQLPLIFERINQNHIDQWWKIGRLKRSINPYIFYKKLKTTMLLSGRIPCDIQVGCQEFMHSKSNDLSSAVQTQFGFHRQQIDHFEIDLKNEEELWNLIRYNSRDTLYIAQLLNSLDILSLSLNISQISGCPWARVQLGHSSFRCESLFLKYFYEKGFVIPDKVISNLKKEPAFPGGMVLQPKRGFYETCILCLDYASLYPSIIIEYNICFTTLDLNNPDPEMSKNNEQKGILPKIMSELLTERQKIKEKIKEYTNEYTQIEEEILNNKNEIKTQNPNNINEIGKLFHNNFISKEQINQDSNELHKKLYQLRLEIQRINTKQLALKSLANSTYGYLGYRHSRFMANSIAALITQIGRNILQNTVEIIEKSGKNSVIYGDTDSVMVDSGFSNITEAIKLAEEISTKITKQFKNIKLIFENLFLKMLLIQKKRYVALVYDAPGKSHQKIKGIELIRRDWCGLTKYLSAYIIDRFLKSNDRDIAICEILIELSRISKLLRNNGIQNEETLSLSNRAIILINTQNSSNESSLSNILSAECFPQNYRVKRKLIFPKSSQLLFKNNNNINDISASYILKEYGINPKLSNDENGFRVLDNIKIEHLTLYMTLTKPLNKYHDNMLPHVRVAKRMEERGEHVSPNMTIAYVIIKGEEKDIGERARIPDEIENVNELDIEWYLSNQVLAPIWRLCDPFGGMSVAMIGRALDIKVAEAHGMTQRDECVAIVIPHICELEFECGNCGEKIIMSYNLRDVMRCSKCFKSNSWKYVANRLGLFLHRFVSNIGKFVCDDRLCDFKTLQLPIGLNSKHKKDCNGNLTMEYGCVEIFNTLRYFKSFFEKSHLNDDEFKEFRNYMLSLISSILQSHGFANIQLSKIFVLPDSQSDSSLPSNETQYF